MMTITCRDLQRLVDDTAAVRDVIDREVPMLADDWGARDEDALVHTLGVNLFAALGRAAGYVGVAEFPVPRAREWQHKLVRVDSAWFARSTRRPVALVEFERFSAETVLEKLTNLYVAAQGCETPPDALVLCVWALDGERVDSEWFDADCHLTVSGGPLVRRPEPSRVMLLQAVFGRRSDAMHFLRFRRLA